MSSVSGLDHQRFLPASLEARLVGYMGRVGGCALLLTVALLWASVLSWSVSDPSLMHATGEAARNYLGTPGAIASDLLLQTLGLAAAIALLAPMLWGLELVGAERVQDFRSKAAYFPLSVLLLAGALSSLPTLPSWPLEHGFGGILGDVVYNFGAAIFSLINAERAGAASRRAVLHHRRGGARQRPRYQAPGPRRARPPQGQTARPRAGRRLASWASASVLALDNAASHWSVEPHGASRNQPSSGGKDLVRARRSRRFR